MGREFVKYVDIFDLEFPSLSLYISSQYVDKDKVYLRTHGFIKQNVNNMLKLFVPRIL